MLLADAALAGPIRMGIETDREVSEPFVVKIKGKYGGVHNTSSKHLRTLWMYPGGRHFVALGPINPLLNLGFWVQAYHPEYQYVSVDSKQSPLLVRPVSLDSFHPRAWRDVLDAPVEDVVEVHDHPLNRASGHLSLFRDLYLRELDESGDQNVSDARLREWLPLFDEIVASSTRGPSWASLGRNPGKTPAGRERWLRAKAYQQLELQEGLREEGRRVHAWLALSADQRRAIRKLTNYGTWVGFLIDERFGEANLQKLGDYVDYYQRADDRHLHPSRNTSWIDPETRVTYRARIIQESVECAWVSVTMDLTRVVPVDLGEMRHENTKSLCRRDGGGWTWERL